MDSYTTGNFAETIIVDAKQWRPSSKRERSVVVVLMKEADGGFSAITPSLPGCGSCGDTEEEAIEHFREALQGLLESYRAEGGKIPWQSTRDFRRPRYCELHYITVEVDGEQAPGR